MKLIQASMIGDANIEPTLYLAASAELLFMTIVQIKDLESQMDNEQRRLVDAQKAQRRTDRRIKELTFSQEEDTKNHERMQELVDKLQNKVKSYKKQIEEAE